MKKIILILFIIFICNINCYALNTFSLGARVPDLFIQTKKGNKSHLDKTYLAKRDDGATLYCIEPFEMIGLNTPYEEYNYNDVYFNLSDDVLDRMNTIAYFGYEYGNHNSLEWYGVTQFLIWNELNLDELYFSNIKGQKIDIYKNEVEELKKLVDAYYLMPSFYNQKFQYSIGTENNIIDLNNVLKNYKVKKSDIDYEINNNILNIKAKEEGSYEISFTKSLPVDRNYSLYALKGSQSLLYPGKSNDIEFKINIEVVSGSISINKEDSEGIDREFATLEGATYGIYKDGNFINKVITDLDGKAYINNLPLGKYEIKELEPSEGYLLDDNVYSIELTFDNRNAIINSIESVIKGEVNLNKFYGSNNNYTLEDGAIFEIYSINDNIVGTYETVNGKINEILDFGNYYLIQRKGLNGYSFIDKFQISIKDSKVYNFDLYDNILIVNVPNTGISCKKHKYYILFILFGLVLVFKSLKNTTVE